MAHIKLPDGLPGITGPLTSYPETAKHLRGLAEELLRVIAARAAGADDKAIHDTVLTAAAFCMFNRYVDGLATWTLEDPKMYEQGGAVRAEKGYLYVAGSNS